MIFLLRSKRWIFLHVCRILVFFCAATTNISSLNHLHTRISGKPGGKGQSKNCHGKSAEHTVIPVPLGTFFRDTNDRLITELKKEGERFIGARGGAGGRGNAFFLSNELRAPMVREDGGRGEEKAYAVELRVMAHVGLVSHFFGPLYCKSNV